MHNNTLYSHVLKSGVVVILLLGTISSCTTTRYVAVPEVHTQYINTVDTIRDSIYHDVLLREYMKGDTIYRDRIEYLYKDRWRTRDSIQIQRDSIPYPVEVIKEVEASLTWWQELRLHIANILLYTLLLYIAYRLIRWRFHL